MKLTRGRPSGQDARRSNSERLPLVMLNVDIPFVG
jgi:hypothetical protein